MIYTDFYPHWELRSYRVANRTNGFLTYKMAQVAPAKTAL